MEERRASLADGVKAVAVDGKTELARWFVAGVQRAQVRNMAGAIVGKGKPGEFLVRDKVRCQWNLARLDCGTVRQRVPLALGA